MSQLVVRNIEEAVKLGLRARAKRHGRSTEEEVREILRNAVRDDSAPHQDLGSRIAARFKGVGADLDLSDLRGQPPRAADFED